ncbi:MAG: hypothetical protein Q9227_006011 [Pyrenula ochraceoflavens]
MAVGFQEIVELSPQQIMSTDPVRRHLWEEAVRKTLNAYAQSQGAEQYVMLRSGQLVGAALMIFVKASILPDVKNVEGSIKKTGMSGIAGNKGAVAIRFEYGSTSLCFVTAHLAAGFANYEERNRDYRTISHGLHFPKNRTIESHSTIIWLGDFNYRIGLSYERCRSLIRAGDLSTLYENDQLNLQMVAGLTFPFYSESRITFDPTYKYDLGTDEYDTSEKSRIPAWCDRILRKGTNLKQIEYNAAPLRFSDHRPVYATFECTITTVNEPLKAKLSTEIYATRRSQVAANPAATLSSSGLVSDDEEEEAERTGYKSIKPGELPPASSDRRKWWLDSDMPARSTLQPPREGLVPNPRRPDNPWAETREPDWVDGERPSSTEGTAKRLAGTRGKPEAPPPRRGGNPAAGRLGGDSNPSTRTLIAPEWEALQSRNGQSSPTPPPPPPQRRRNTPQPTNLLDGSPVEALPSSMAPLRPSNTPTPSTTPPSPAAAAVHPTNVLQKKKAPPPKPKKPTTLTPTPTSSSLTTTTTTTRAFPLPTTTTATSLPQKQPNTANAYPPPPTRRGTASSISSIPSTNTPSTTATNAKRSLPPPHPLQSSQQQPQPQRKSSTLSTTNTSSPPPPSLPPRKDSASTAPSQSIPSAGISKKKVPPPNQQVRGGRDDGEDEKRPALPPRRGTGTEMRAEGKGKLIDDPVDLLM